MQDAVVVAATRTAVGKAPNGTLKTVRPDEMAATVIGEALRRAPGIDPRDVDDVIMGCAMPEAEQGLNVARIASLRAGVPVDASAVTMNRFCASGLIRSGVQAGSNTTSTVEPVTSSSSATFVSTSPGSDWAAGQFGDVSVMRTCTEASSRTSTP